ncbi:putative chaperone protein [Luteibacter rhizovicinus]|uniref:Putative chaperone protein n=1 Tax=Luteibacter rhizovicinus TaxID=242606 RepID=A0A4R3YGU3_9GAMM|nr:Hsp70 family protein [Luteibacter rhizovicinus]TCV91182.1 putative chaperone protein [Luteibacter rhizovicinus]
MRIGIDFGTSYSAAAAIIDGDLRLVRFGDARQFRTAVFFPEVVPNVEDFVLTPVLEAQVDAIVRASRADERQAGLPARPEMQLHREAVRIVRRQWMEEQTRAVSASVASFQDAMFGEDAVDAYLEEGTGNLIESPKSMFGYKLDPRVRKTIVSIAAHILEHIRLTATQQFGVPVREAVIGRPVEFRSSMGPAGGEQALGILREAADIAGFDAVTFLEEPAAAAMAYHMELTDRQRAVIVDIGGGTTDVAYAELGGGIAPIVHRSWGLPRGGTDLDIGVSLHSFMPHFGKDLSGVPVHHFVEAASVHNLPKQREFRKQDYRLVDEPFGARLRALQSTGATTRLNQSAERMKIDLSSAPTASATLDFIEADLTIEANDADFQAASDDFLDRMQRLLEETRNDLPEAPGSIFLTGGTSRSPQVQARVRTSFPGISVVHGDPSLGVVSGLARAALG